MSILKPNGRDPHPVTRIYTEDYRAGKISRREFLARSTALGATTATVYGLIGLSAPARAGGHVQQGGTLRIQQDVQAITEPRLFEWSEMGNITRGWLEYLVSYERDGSITPVLLDSWEVSDDARTYRLNLRPEVRWNNGDDFTAADVLANFVGWCDTTVEGSSTPGRMGSLVDRDTGQLRDGAVVAEDDLTVVLNFVEPDIAIMAGLADYPMAVVHRDQIGANPIENPIGTGAYIPEEYIVGERATIVRNPDHTWWNAENGAFVDRIEFLDFGIDPAAHLAAIEAGDVDMTYESVGEFVSIMDSLGLARSEAETAATVVIRARADFQDQDGNQPYADKRVRQAIALAVDNEIVLELGYNNLGKLAENHHISPIHPAYAELPPPEHNPARARELMTEAGFADYEHEIFSLDDGFESDSTSAVAAQLRDAGFNVKRTVLPGSAYWNDWQAHSFSATAWNHRPLDIQVPLLAYRSDGPWNESGFANEEYDRVLTEAAQLPDADRRRGKVRRLQEIMQEEAVIVQPYWRSLYRHHVDGLVGAEMHPQFEIRYQYIGFA